MKFKKGKFKSKKAMTLVELIVGITIVVIVFAGTLGAIVSGYTTTIKNADQNKVAAKNAAVNEVIMQAVKIQGWTEEQTLIPNAIDEAAKSECTDVVYVEPSMFPDDTYDCQYTLIFDNDSSADISKVNTPSASQVEIRGVTIRTSMKYAGGIVTYESFVPYSE